MKHCKLGPALGALALLGALSTSGCRREPAGDEASVRESLAERTGAEILSEAEKSTYAPPADGRLTPGQVEMYLAVKRREGSIRAVLLNDLRAKGAPRPGEGPRNEAGALATAGVRAAQELGHDPKEYRWVEDRVREAEMDAARRGMAERIEAGRRRYLERLEARRRATTDPAERAEIERRIAELRRRTARASPAPDPVTRHNADLLARYRAQLEEVRAQLAGGEVG